MGTSCMLAGGPIGLTERAVCHIHCRQTPSSSKLCIFSVAARHCLKRMERLQYIMRSCAAFYLCSFFTVTSAYLTSLSYFVRFCVSLFCLGFFLFFFFCSSFQSLVLSSLSFFFCLSCVSFLIGGLKLLYLELDKLNDAGIAQLFTFFSLFSDNKTYIKMYLYWHVHK